MAFILKSDTASTANTGLKLYRDALVNEATLFSFDCQNTYGWDTPGVLPVDGKIINDLSLNNVDMQFADTGFLAPSGDGIRFGQNTDSALEIGSNGDVNLGPMNVTGFFFVVWLKFENGYTRVNQSGLLGTDENAALFFNQFGLDNGTDAESFRYVLGRGAGSSDAIQVGNLDDDIAAHEGELIQLAVGFESDGTSDVLTKYINGVATNSTTESALPVKSEAAAKFAIGRVGSGQPQAFTLYRSFMEITSVSSGAQPASGENIAERIALDYRVNGGRFVI